MEKVKKATGKKANLKDKKDELKMQKNGKKAKQKGNRQNWAK